MRSASWSRGPERVDDAVGLAREGAERPVLQDVDTGHQGTASTSTDPEKSMEYSESRSPTSSQHPL